MADPKCRRWLKKEFLVRVNCDSGLLSKVAKSNGFKFYTTEKIVIEDLDNNGEETQVMRSLSVREYRKKL